MTTAPNAFYPFAELVDRIAALCAQRETGHLVLISDDNRMAQMHLLQGLIVFLMCRGRRGRDALPLMRTISSARMSLNSDATVNSDGTAFSTASVLAYLKGSSEQLPEPTSIGQAPQSAPSNAPQDRPQGPARPQPAKPAAPMGVTAGGRSGVTPDVQHLLQAVLVRYIGPMAEFVCSDHFGAIQDLQALVTALAAEIPNPDQRAAFKAEIARSLGIAAT